MNDVILFGYSKTAQEIASLLKKNKRSFTILTTNETRTDLAIADGYDAHYINYNSDEELIKYGISKEVKTLFCVSGDYNRNLFVTLSARALDPDLFILSLAADKAQEKKMLLAGANKNINPYTVGANRIFRLIKKPVVYRVLDEILFHKSDIKITEVIVPETSRLINIPLFNAKIEADYELMVLGIQGVSKRAKFRFHTYKIRRRIKAGDILVVIGEEKNIEKFIKDLYK